MLLPRSTSRRDDTRPVRSTRETSLVPGEALGGDRHGILGLAVGGEAAQAERQLAELGQQRDRLGLLPA